MSVVSDEMSAQVKKSLSSSHVLIVHAFTEWVDSEPDRVNWANGLCQLQSNAWAMGKITYSGWAQHVTCPDCLNHRNWNLWVLERTEL